LQGLDHGAPLPETVLEFELTALRLVGHLPSLEQCVACGRAVENEGRVAVSMMAGGVLCGGCRPGRRSVVSVSSEVIQALRSAGEEANSGSRVQFDPAIQRELRAVMSNYFAHLVGHKLRLSDYL